MATLTARPATNWRPYIILLIGVLAVSTASLFIRSAQNNGAGSFLIAAWRLGFATLILTPIVLRNHQPELQSLSRRQIGFAMLSGVFLALHFGLWVTSLEYTSVIISVVLVTTNPLWVALIAPFFINERITRGTLVAVFIAMIGGIIISAGGDAGSAPRQDQPLFGAALALGGAITVSGYLLIGRHLRATVSLVPYIWMTYGSAAFIMIIAVLLKGEQVTGLAPDAYLFMTLGGLIPQLIGHSSYNYALGFLSAAYVSLTVLAEPIGSTILASIFLNEVPKPIQYLGGLIIFVALLVASREEGRRAVANKPRPSDTA